LTLQEQVSIDVGENLRNWWKKGSLGNKH
jgi:hypothetical protein